jgi:hypothetical protein
MRITRAITLGALALAITHPLQAQTHLHPPLHVDPRYEDCAVKFAATLTQPAFHRFAREFGSASAYKPGGPASTLGKGRISVSVEMMRFSVDEWSDAWNDTFAHPDEHHPLGSRRVFPKLNVRVGVADNADAGVYYTRNPNSNYGWLGLDARYRILAEDAGKPVTMALRGAYTRTLYVSDMDMNALSASVSVERRVWNRVRPYGGFGADAVLANETSDAVTLRSERIVVPHVFAGFDVTLLQRVTVGAEIMRGALTTTQLQVGAVVF